jgi:copper chaperone
MELNQSQTTLLTLAVEGMSCEHCKVAIADHVERVPGVESVDVDLDAKRVEVRGTDVHEAAVVSAIDDAGYEAVRA